MSCSYEHNGIYYTKEELIDVLTAEKMNENLLFSKNQKKINQFEDDLMRYLQFHDVVGKTKFAGEYYVKKTAPYDDSTTFAPEETERKNLEKIANLNDKYGYQAIVATRKGNGYVVSINSQQDISFGSKTQDVIGDNVDQDFKDYLVNNLYITSYPVTSDLLFNSVEMAQALDRPDLARMGKFIYTFLSRNPSLTTEMKDNFENDVTLSKQHDTKERKLVSAYYQPASNKIFFNLENLAGRTIEQNIEAIYEELLHSLTVQPFYRNQDTLTKNEKDYVAATEELFSYYKSKSNDKGNYRFQNKEEFIIGLLLDNEFRSHLDEIDIKNNTTGLFNRIIRWFLRRFSDLLNINYVESVGEMAMKRMGYEDVLVAYLKSVDGVTRGNLLREKGREYDRVFPAMSTNKRGFRDKRIAESIDKFKSNIEQIKRTGISSKLTEAQQVVLEGIKKEVNMINENDVEKVALFTEYVNDLNKIIQTNFIQLFETKDDEKMSPDDKLVRLHNIMLTTKAFDLSIQEISKLKNFINESDPALGRVTDEIISNRSAISSNYNDIILPIVLDKYDNIYENSVIEGMEKLNKELAFQENVLKQREAQGDKSRTQMAKNNIARLKAEKLTKLPTRQRVEDLLTGKAKDTNLASMYLESWAVNGDPTIAGLVDYIKSKFSESSVELQSLTNKVQNEIDAYVKGSGESTNNPEKFHEGIIETVKQIDKYEDGIFTYKERLALVNQYKKEYIKDAQEYIYKINEIRAKYRLAPSKERKQAVLDELRQVKKEQRQWEKDYMEREYTDEYYAVFEILYEDLGGFTAAESLNDVDAKINNVEKAINTTSDEETLDQLYEQKEDLLRERKRIYSVFDKPEGSKERKIAEQLTKYKSESKKLADYVLTSKSAIKFKRDKEKLDERLASGEITQAQYSRWVSENTVQESFKNEFWDKYNKAITRLSDVLKVIGVQKNDNLSEVYNNLRAVANIYRNVDGIIEGQDVSKEEASAIKKMQEKIQELKEKTETMIGLTKEEKKRYYELLHISYDPYISDLEWSKYSAEFATLNNKKRKISKAVEKEYQEAITELNMLSESVETVNYFEEYEKQLKLYAETLAVVTVPNTFIYKDTVYTKKGNSWFTRGGEEATNAEFYYRMGIAESRFDSSPWYKANHFKVDRWVPDADGFGGSYMEVDQPIYIWMRMEPKDKDYIDTELKPSFKYRERIVKPEYKNPNYRSGIDGYNTPKLKGAKDDRYINKEYDKLDSHKKKYLNFLTDTHLGYQKNIPASQRLGYFLPSLRKDWIESVQQGDITAKSIQEKLGELARRTKEAFAYNEQDKDNIFGYIGNDYDILPVKFTGDIGIEDQSRDATRAILLFAGNNIEYKKLNEAYPFAQAVKHIVSDPENVPVQTDMQGNTLKKLIRGKMFGVRKSGSNRMKLVDEMIRTYFFGEKKKAEAVAKAADTTFGIASKMMLGLNATSMISNFANAEIQKVLYMGTDGFFTYKEYGQAYSRYASLVPSLIKDATKIGNKSLHGQVIDYFGGINSEFRTAFAKDLKYTGLQNTAAAIMMPTSIAENEISNTVFIAVALNFKVKQLANTGNVKDDKFISVYDAFELDKAGNLTLKKGVVMEKADYDRFKRRLTAAMRKVNGNYNNLDTTLAEKYTFGRMVFFMNKFYVPFFANRWANQRYNFEVDDITEGYYRTFLKRFWGDLKRFNINMLKNWKDMTPEERSAFKKVGIEIAVSGICMAFTSLLGGDKPEELKENSIVQNNLIYQLKIIRSQNEAFIPFPTLGLNEMINRVKNPFPLMSKITNIAKLTQDTWYLAMYPLGLAEDKDIMYMQKSGWHDKGDLKIFTDLDRLLGVHYRFMNIANPEIAIKNFEASQRIK